jgi:hypothetical protein
LPQVSPTTNSYGFAKVGKITLKEESGTVLPWRRK